jgi:hypothetical protein
MVYSPLCSAFFSADATMFRKYFLFALKNCPKTYFSLIFDIFYTNANRPKTSPKSQILFHKNGSPCDLYVMNLLSTVVLPANFMARERFICRTNFFVLFNISTAANELREKQC